MELFKQLGETRAEKNDLHDAKMRAWDQHRPQLSSNAAFEALWQSTEGAKRYESLRKREQEILIGLEGIKGILEHRKPSRRDDVAA